MYIRVSDRDDKPDVADMKDNLSKGLLILGCFIQSSPPRSNMHPNSVSQGVSIGMPFMTPYFLISYSWCGRTHDKGNAIGHSSDHSTLHSSGLLLIFCQDTATKQTILQRRVGRSRLENNTRDGPKHYAKLSELTFRTTTVVGFVVIAGFLSCCFEKRWKVFQTMANST